MLRTALAVTAGKLSAGLIQALRMGSATSLPGKVALKLDDHLLENLGSQVREKTVAITGTNGKSTTAGLLSAFIEASGSQVVHNQLGANMVPGITAALLKESSFSGRLSADYGVIEVDEASLPHVAKSIHQDLTVVTNLFRDQLDRYGELDTTAKLIQEGIRHSNGCLALNADDPMVAHIGRGFSPDKVVYYGVENVDYPKVPMLDFPVGFPREVTDCPVCQTPLVYSRFLYGHLGHYQCSSCDFIRPTPWLQAEQIQVSAAESRLVLSCEGQTFEPLTLSLPGLFNAYNLLAAATAGLWIPLPMKHLSDSIGAYHSIFGRAEKKQIDGKAVMILLIKNPIGATEVLKVVTADPSSRLVIMINDDYADGRDISWLWDAPFEMLAETSKPVIVSGHRAEDMAVRLRYAGLPEELIRIEPEIMPAFHHGLRKTASDETLYVLPTYTALLHLSQSLRSR
jgi:lipid II isoglutaminyl synthase (glutamine-hydrolysing)